MNFSTAFKKYSIDNIFDFTGRASRWEYFGGFSFAYVLTFVGLFITSFVSEALFDIAYPLELFVGSYWNRRILSIISLCPAKCSGRQRMGATPSTHNRYLTGLLLSRKEFSFFLTNNFYIFF